MSWRRPVMWWYTQVDAMPMMIERLTVWFMCTKCIPGKRRLINVADIVQLRRHHLHMYDLSLYVFMRILDAFYMKLPHILTNPITHFVDLPLNSDRPQQFTHMACPGNWLIARKCADGCPSNIGKGVWIMFPVSVIPISLGLQSTYTWILFKNHSL